MSICFFSVGAVWKILDRNSRDHQCCNKFPKPPLEGCTSVCTSVYFVQHYECGHSFIYRYLSTYCMYSVLYTYPLSLYIYIYKIK